MAKDQKQEFVTHITPRSEDFSQWYTDVIKQTEWQRTRNRNL